jgi:nucleotide-binding universal stress UspA family protein
MTIKSILCIFEGSKDELNAVNAAFLLAETFGAKIRFLHISQEYTGIYDEGMVMNMDIISSIEQTNKERLKKAQKYIESLAENYHIPLDSKDNSAHHARAEIIHKTGHVESSMEEEGRASDIIVIGRSKDDQALSEYIGTTALFNSGRPLLLLPKANGHMPSQWEDKIISIAWNGSMESSRSIFNAMPLLERAEKIYLLVVRDHNRVSDIQSNQEIMGYLSSHGAHINCIIMDSNSHLPAEMILEKAKELKSDLLVMGAYGHSRLREIILGGFTKYMMEKADIPLILSH